MWNRIRQVLVPTLALAIGLSAQIPTAQIYAQQAPEYGPPTGTIVIVGVGLRDAGIFELFIELGVPNELHTVPGGRHGGFDREQTLAIFETIRRFLSQHGLGGGLVTAQ